MSSSYSNGSSSNPFNFYLINLHMCEHSESEVVKLGDQGFSLKNDYFTVAQKRSNKVYNIYILLIFMLTKVIL